MDKKTASQQTALELLNLAHKVPLNPISKVYFQSFLDQCNEKSINLPENFIKSKICLHCGVLFIPGITLSVRIKYRKLKKLIPGRPRRRLLSYQCLQCKKSQTFEGLLVPKKTSKTNSPETPEVKPTFEAVWPQVTKEKMKFDGNRKPMGSNKDTKSSLLARNRAKKRKENSLMSIINKKKENESKSLNLMDFMK